MEGQPLYNRFLDKGREGRNHPGLYIAGVVLILVAYILGQIPLLIALFRAIASGHISVADPELDKKILDPQAMNISANTLLLLELSMFVVAMLGTWLVVAKLHRKKFSSIISYAERIRWKRVWFSFALVIIILCTFLFITVSNDKSIEFRFSAGPFFGTLIIAILLLPIQTWWEEFFFRGYLMQAFGLKTKAAWIPLLITSLIFGGMHMANMEVDKYGIAASLPMYILPGFFLGLMTVMDEGLELAMGYHLANNFFGTVFITSPDSSIKANALYYTESASASGEILSTIILNLIIISLFWFMYRWNIQKLFRKHSIA